jgi:isoleucyl-tRNA synthetase
MPSELATFDALRDELRFLLITSEARMHQVNAPPVDAVSATHGGVWIAVKPTAALKCVRCWHRRPEVGSNAEHPELCGRCVINLSDPGEKRVYA